MGCGATKESSSSNTPPALALYMGTSPKLDATTIQAADATGVVAATAVISENITAPTNCITSPATGLTKSSSGAQQMRMPGKEKYIMESGAVVMDDRPKGGWTSLGLLLLYCAPVTNELTISYRENSSGAVFAKRFTDKELLASKEAAGIPFSWGPFFKSLASDVLKGKAIVQSLTHQTKEVRFTIVNSKEPNVTYLYLCTLEEVSGPGHSAKPTAVLEYFVAPLTRMLQIRHHSAEMSNRMTQVEKIESDFTVKSASARHYKKKVQQLLTIIRPLREESSITAQRTMKLALEVKAVERRLRLIRDTRIKKHPLDELYENGGAQYFEHVPQAEKHFPLKEVVDPNILACIRSVFPLSPGMKLENVVELLDRPALQPYLTESSSQSIRDVFKIFQGIDRWDYDAIQLEIITNGNALFYTTYLLMYKLDLVAHFNLDDEILQRFLLEVQSGYHPNPYHNAMHAADVTQINYYIIMIAGLKEKCELSKEEILAAVIAGAIHDFDHPGLNNNFHSKTNAYLSTLYNDRSILENHHVASVYELLKNPAYNVFAPLNDEQLRVVRETMIEMVLATDMGNHGRIFKSFQLRMGETTDWHTNKTDVRLALSMSIKMADISNCARPHYIYAEWARNIAREFYNQGDAEVACNLPISPFMDRTKEIVDFPKGQISFMMYIVIPMVEVISEFLPSLRFALQYCNENKQIWQKYQEEHSSVNPQE
ncbi:putative 3, 5-cyclic nucleotide phosphodiesterase [Trypanosoma theileri]|uniref:Phosphodiesterase n=1 Tax=Trypanosoma theileri TaxID=67003 RepID=A0A1X0P936_9TRYP|nr:putative 3, 5-cyclic nucleotide phosphodiesterase [Trypanosoma theileri]ORC93444.1 putative 3, 5-cyclic nucleotide phosphodiesterase [Trypanosoma theileri]